MSSPQTFQASSPLSASGVGRRKSRFTYKNVSQLALSATSCPLRVIAHADLDAFYAQCEMVRLNVPKDQPLAVRQWQGLIAINYPAREFGLNRHITITEAKKLCPNLITQHVPTWKEGDKSWAYHDEAFENMATHKVSLDPYRLESRRILACIKETLPATLQRVEKASVDEFFLDLSAHVYSVLLERYPELAGPAPYDDPTEYLPLPSTTALDWQADALVDLDTGETEEDDPDWDDVAILIGSEIIRKLRSDILQKLKYTCSAGIARNKMLAKLGSAYKKPNQQTVVRNRAAMKFLADLKFNKIRGLGGKLGEQITSEFDTDTVKDLLSVPLEKFKLKLGDDTGTWIHQMIRGHDTSEVNPRTQIKSMLSAKSFRPSISTPEQAHRWLRIFVADIHSRLVEEGVAENKRRPKTINLYHRQAAQTKSRSCPIPLGKKLDQDSLFELAHSLLGLIIQEGRVWPCSNLSLSVGGFEDGGSGNMGIGAFLIKGTDVEAVKNRDSELSRDLPDENRADKRRRLDGPMLGIQRFFPKTQRTSEYEVDFDAQPQPTLGPQYSAIEQPTLASLRFPELSEMGEERIPTGTSELYQPQSTGLACTQCSQMLESVGALQSHQDWHFASDLQNAERQNRLLPRASASTPNPPRKVLANSTRQKNVQTKREKGQSRLPFG